jgi:hypothetical protein
LRAFPCHLRTDDHKEHHYQHEQQNVDHRDGPVASAQNAFQTAHQRAHQVGEENGEQKRDQRGAGDVEKSQCQREQQHRHQTRAVRESVSSNKFSRAILDSAAGQA